MSKPDERQKAPQPDQRLDPELAETLRQAGPERYAEASARWFAGQSRSRARPRYAKT